MTREERDELRKRYRDDVLYKAWSHPLMELERELHQPAPEEIWHLTEKLHGRLCDLGEDAPYEIDYVFRDICDSLIGGDTTRGDAMFTSAVISTVLLSQLCAAKPKGDGENPNRPSCRALARILTKDEFLPVVGSLMEMLRQERIDLAGRKVIVPVTNYLDQAETSKHLSASTIKEIDHWVEEVWNKTRPLHGMMRVSEDTYRQLWNDILVMPYMLTRIKEVSPRRNAWAMNMKMVANVLGIMMTHLKMEDNQLSACNLLGMPNARPYIGNYADFNGSYNAFSKPELKKVTEMVKAMEC